MPFVQKNSKNSFFIIILSCAALFAQDNRIAIYSGQHIFSSGMNMAWGGNGGYARDAVDLNEETFIQALDEISAAGGNTMRWWLHINGTNSPQFTNDTVSGITQTEINNVKRILDLAFERKMTICISLWSHDMLNGNNGTNFRVSANQFMLSDSAATMAYINNALIPLVNDVGGHPGIFCWEIFNEPEGMILGLGWTGNSAGGVWTTYPNIKRFTNLAAGAIHRADPEALVTTGTHRISYISEVRFTNHYDDAELISYGGDSLGILDFYQVHYYPYFGINQSPFAHPYSYWELDKPLVIGEFSAHGPNGEFSSPTPQQAYQYLYDNGYAGAWSWTWTGHDGNGNVTDAAEGMLPLAQNYPEDIVIKLPAGFIEEFELQKSTMALGDSVRLSWVTTDSSQVSLNGMPLAQSDTVWLSPLSTTDYVFIAWGDIYADTMAFTINVLQNGEIEYFTASSSVIEQGDSTLLSWKIVGDSSYITLNGDSVGPLGSVYFQPLRDATFILATDGPLADTSIITITVLQELAINRAIDRPAYASTFETCCGGDLVAGLAVDGNSGTRWSSAWGTGNPVDANTDDNPDDEWIYVDLQGYYNIKRVVLDWEAAHAESFNIEVSSDAVIWTVIDSVRGKTSPTRDDLNDLSGSGRFVRMHGLNRATEFGYSLWEFQIFGTTANGYVTPDYVDDFENGRLDGWNTAHDSTFGLHEANGLLTINYNRTNQYSAEWDNFWFTPHTPVAAYSNPIITVRVRSTVYTQLQLKPIYDDGGEDWAGLSTALLSNNQWRTISFSLQNADAPMSIMYLYLDGGTTAPKSGIIQFEFISIGTEFEEDITSKLEESETLSYNLNNAYPNPFNPVTTIEFSLKKNEKVKLTVYNILGREIITLIDGNRQAGLNRLQWNARDHFGNKVSSGIYFYRLQTESGFVKTKKLILLK